MLKVLLLFFGFPLACALGNPQIGKKRILCPSIHPRVIDSLAQVIREIEGYELCVLSQACKPTLKELTACQPNLFNFSSHKELANWGSDNKGIVLIKNFNELLETPPDILFLDGNSVPAHSNTNAYEKIWPEAIRSGKTKIVIYSGFTFGRPPKNCKNFLCADGSIYRRNFQRALPHILGWIPWIDKDKLFAFKGASLSTNLGTYISRYPKRFKEPECYELYLSISENLKKMPWAQNCVLNLYANLNFLHVPKAMDETFASLHIKPREGFGYAILESMFKGKPVFIYLKPEDRDNRQKFKCLNWCLEGETAFIFSSAEEFYEKIEPFLTDDSKRLAIQERCAKKIREHIDFDAERERVRIFLENLLPQYNED